TTAASGDQPDPGTTGDDLSESVVVSAAADLVTVKTLASGDATPAEGDTVTYLITVTNNGAAQATNVSLSDSLPSGLTATANNGTTLTGTYTAGTGVWSIGTLANGASATLTLEGTVDAGQGGSTITNTTTAASGDQPDPGTTGDDLSESVVVSNDIDAIDDTPSPINGAAGGSIPNVVVNDTLNGTLDPVIGTDVTVNEVGLAQDGVTTLGLDVTPAAGSITLDSTSGVLTVAVGTTAGSYIYTYEICDVLNPSNCDTAEVTIVVEAAPIVANDDDFSGAPVDTFTGGATESVLVNDTLGGVLVPADGSATTATLVDIGGLTGVTISDDGVISVPVGATPGTYVLTYQLCDELNPSNCDVATVTIVVDEPSLLDAIATDLVTILTDDLVTTITEQGDQMESYASSALDRLRTRTGESCLVDANREAKDILFDTDKAILKPESHRILDAIGQILGTCRGTRFEIAGHTDSDASDAYNYDLSQRRVDAVLKGLIARGVDTEGFIARGYGESRPVASNATAEGKAMNRRVEFVLLNDFEEYDACYGGRVLKRKINAKAKDGTVQVDGRLFSENYDCIRDEWHIVEGSLRYLETDRGQSQSQVNLSYRRERFVDENSIRGWFMGIYNSQNDISYLADGEINGVGVNGGIYGADQMRNGLFLDYYLGFAAGRHQFDLSFSRNIGTIDATGHYSYYAGFAGAAISGDLKFGKVTMTPRIGFNYAYAPGADVDVITDLGGITQMGNLELGSVSGGRLYAEIRHEWSLEGGASNIAFTPRLACYKSLSVSALDGECSFGGSLELFSADEDSDFVYQLRVDAERGRSFTSGSLTASAAKRVRYGIVRVDTAVTRNGALSFGSAVKLSF
ncbi:OmpA family protein, partial [Alisedimentitalea sp. MJ-SS2]|uniref:OmpA family protein n=1 Tax=Aliisedimentitalea sp. MJ-SS2 TaxID=3049795 RepID=UPI00291255A2